MLGTKKSFSGATSAIALAIGVLATPTALYAQNSGSDDASDVDDGDIVVTGIRASLQKSLDTKRNADALVEVISSEDIGKFPDKNVAESLQRLTGVSINREFGEGERVSVRGTDTNLTRTLLNGHAVGTADWFVLDQLEASRSFNYLMLPSEIVSRLRVYKSPTADIDEGGIGATIIVETVKPLDGKAFSVAASVGGIYNDLAEKLSPTGTVALNWHNADETFGINVSGIYQERNLRRDNTGVLSYDRLAASAQNPSVPAGGVIVPGLIGHALFRQKRVRKGINGAIQWRPSEKFELNLTGLYSQMDADNYNNNYLAAPNRKLGGLFSVSNIVNGAALTGSIPQGQGGFSLIYDAIAREASTRTSSYDAELIFRPSDSWKFRLQGGFTAARGATERQFIWETLASNPGINFDLTSGVPEVNFVGLDPTSLTDPSVLAEVGWAGGGFEITNTDEEFYFFADAEHEFEGDSVFRSAKVGLKYTDHDRVTNQVDQQRRSLFGWSGPQGTGCDANGVSQTFPTKAALAASGIGSCTLGKINQGFTPDNFLADVAAPGTLRRFPDVNPNIILAISNAIPATDFSKPVSTGAAAPPASTQNVNVFNPGGSFRVSEETYGGYAMTNLEGPSWKGNFGLRVVHTKVGVRGWQPGLSAGDPGTTTDNFGINPGESGGYFAPIIESAEYTDVLPSLNFSFDVNDDLVLRLAAARTMTRPNYNQLVRSISINQTLFTGVGGGSPDLDPFRANQFDASLEWYFAPQSVLSVGLFYKSLESVIVSADGIERLRISPAVNNNGTPANPADDTPVLNPDCTFVSGTFPVDALYDCNIRVTRPRNVAGATIKGIELSYQQPIWGGFGVLANYTYTDAQQRDGLPMPGASEHLVNLTGFYENDWLSARLSYTYRSEFFIKIDRANPLNQEGTSSLDASVTFTLNDNISFSLDAVNLMDENLRQFSGTKERVRNVSDNGRTFFFTARAKF